MLQDSLHTSPLKIPENGHTPQLDQFSLALSRTYCTIDGLRELVDYADIYSLTAPRPLQCQNGLLEPPSQFYVPLARQTMEEVRTIYNDMAKPENMVLDVHNEGHVIDLPSLVDFLDKHLPRD